MQANNLEFSLKAQFQISSVTTPLATMLGYSYLVQAQVNTEHTLKHSQALPIHHHNLVTLDKRISRFPSTAFPETYMYVFNEVFSLHKLSMTYEKLITFYGV